MSPTGRPSGEVQAEIRTTDGNSNDHARVREATARGSRWEMPEEAKVGNGPLGVARTKKHAEHVHRDENIRDDNIWLPRRILARFWGTAARAGAGGRGGGLVEGSQDCNKSGGGGCHERVGRGVGSHRRQGVASSNHLSYELPRPTRPQGWALQLQRPQPSWFAPGHVGGGQGRLGIRSCSA